MCAMRIPAKTAENCPAPGITAWRRRTIKPSKRLCCLLFTTDTFVVSFASITLTGKQIGERPADKITLFIDPGEIELQVGRVQRNFRKQQIKYGIRCCIVGCGYNRSDLIAVGIFSILLPLLNAIRRLSTVTVSPAVTWPFSKR